MPIPRLFSCLLPVIMLAALFACGFPVQAGATSITASAARSGACATISTVRGEYFGTICARGTASFTMQSPLPALPAENSGIDWDAARERELCVLFALSGNTIHDAEAILYPETTFTAPGESLEDAVAAGENPRAQIGPETAYASESGVRFILRFSRAEDESFPIRATAYTLHNDIALSLTLAARSRQALWPHALKLHGLMRFLRVDTLDIVPD